MGRALRSGVALAVIGMIAGCGGGSSDGGGMTVQAPGVNIKLGPDGASVQAPGVNVDAGAGGAKVQAPGVNATAGPEGASVQAPGTNVQLRR